MEYRRQQTSYFFFLIEILNIRRDFSIQNKMLDMTLTMSPWPTQPKTIQTEILVYLIFDLNEME